MEKIHSLNRSISDRITLYWGDVSTLAAEYFVQAEDARVTILAAALSGPFCVASHTLPARYPLKSVGEEKPQVFTGVLPDPCFWTPGSPFTYKLELNLRESITAAKWSESLLVGIRPLGIRNTDLYLADRRYVMRVIEMPPEVKGATAEKDILEFCLQSGSVLLLCDPDQSLLAEATRQGVMLAVRIESVDPARVVAELNQLACWPAVGMVILATELALETPLPSPATSLLRAIACRPSRPVPPWAQVFIVEESFLGDVSLKSEKRPQMVCCRVGPAEVSIKAARQACDDLQRRTAAQPQIAGYIASSQNELY